MPHGTPHRNGVSECRNRTLLDMVQYMMSLTRLPLSFWGYALETVAFTLNREPSKSIETTPYELWFGKKPKMLFLKVWGCDAYVKNFNLISSKPNRRNVSSEDIQRKLLDTPSITDPKARLLLLNLETFWRRSFSRKK